MDTVVLEKAFKNWNKQGMIKKILSVEPELAVAKGQNFLSLIKRLKMKVVLGDGRIALRTAIFKDCNVPSKAHNAYINEMSVFKTETMMYTSVLREMEYLLEEINATDDVPWCRLHHYEPYSSMLLEDLRPLGFKSLLSPCYLDIDHVELVLRNLGLFHGMSKILEERGLISESNYSTWYVFNKRANRIWHSYLQELISVMNKNWNPSWKPIVSKLKNLTVKDIEHRMEEIENFSPSTFKVLNHGDIIIPNIMFKYDWRNRPVSMRFVDFQLPTFGTPCLDLTYFLNRSLQGSFIKKNLKQLIEFYHTSLVTTLDKFDFKGRKPTSEELLGEMERMSFLGSIVFLINYAPISTSEGDFGDQLFKDRILGLFNRQEAEEELGPTIREFVERHLSS